MRLTGTSEWIGRLKEAVFPGFLHRVYALRAARAQALLSVREEEGGACVTARRGREEERCPEREGEEGCSCRDAMGHLA